MGDPERQRLFSQKLIDFFETLAVAAVAVLFFEHNDDLSVKFVALVVSIGSLVMMAWLIRKF